MAVHALLSRHLPAQVATIATGLWFALLLGLVLFCGSEVTGAFRYQNF